LFEAQDGKGLGRLQTSESSTSGTSGGWGGGIGCTVPHCPLPLLPTPPKSAAHVEGWVRWTVEAATTPSCWFSWTVLLPCSVPPLSLTPIEPVAI
jgi:hypothetical protein